MANFLCPLPVRDLQELARAALSVLEAEAQGMELVRPAREESGTVARPLLQSHRAIPATSTSAIRRQQELSASAQSMDFEQQEDTVEPSATTMPETLKELVDQSEPLPTGSPLPDFGPIAPPTNTTIYWVSQRQ